MRVAGTSLLVSDLFQARFAGTGAWKAATAENDRALRTKLKSASRVSPEWRSVQSACGEDTGVLRRVPAYGGLLLGDDKWAHNEIAALALELHVATARPCPDIEVSLSAGQRLCFPLSTSDILAKTDGVVRVVDGAIVFQCVNSHALVPMLNTKSCIGPLVSVSPLACVREVPEALGIEVRVVSEMSEAGSQVARQAIGLLEQAWPELLEDLVETKTGLALLGTGRARHSFSSRLAPNIVFAGADDPVDMAELIVHEYLHLRLFAIEAVVDFVRAGDGDVYSPWKGTKRKAEALLHALYVFDGVSEFYDRVAVLTQLTERGRHRSAIRLCGIEQGCNEALSVHERLTTQGIQLVQKIAERCSIRLQDSTHTMQDEFAWAKMELKENRRRVDQRDGPDPWYVQI